MGIVMKRRDNAPIVKYVYGNMIEKIMVDRNYDIHINPILKKFRQAKPSIKFDRIKTHYGTGYSWHPKSLGVTS